MFKRRNRDYTFIERRIPYGSDKNRSIFEGASKRKNLTQEQLAEKLNVSGRTISRWETGSNIPKETLHIEYCRLCYPLIWILQCHKLYRSIAISADSEILL
ncbi:MAG: helix-turn-helix domain-containing protein [Firmicutes bacterium]|nr:helix-turn-helix domain-containing protein [Bacillota bacterium]